MWFWDEWIVVIVWLGCELNVLLIYNVTIINIIVVFLSNAEQIEFYLHYGFIVLSLLYVILLKFMIFMFSLFNWLWRWLSFLALFVSHASHKIEINELYLWYVVI